MPTTHDITLHEVCTMASGHKLELAVHTVEGTNPGPTLVLFGGIHGDEAMGVEGVRRIVAALEAEELNGRVIAVPVCNPLAYETMTRHTKQDGLNLNRIFPGDASGSVTEQVAATLSAIQQDADYFIDYHSSGLYSTVSYAYLHEEGRGMAQAYGTSLLYHHDAYTGSSTELALRRSVPAMVSELGGGGQDTERYLDRALFGTINVLKQIGIIEKTPWVSDTPQIVLTEIRTLRPTQGGIIASNFPPEYLETMVPKDTVLGKVINPHTFEELEEITAPFDPTYLVLTREEFTRNNPGDYGFMVGDGATTTSVDALFGAEDKH